MNGMTLPEYARHLEAQIELLQNEVAGLHNKLEKACPMIGAAMRCGYVNQTQKEALMFAAEHLQGEENRTILDLLVSIRPKYTYD